ncbi:TetR family transcriptional regulator [Parvibaculum sp.]|uniref:TetR family transcriptional regulator n=1 Tax=Parvibaculum sp. TaxID=2024848 RepID=UPI00391D3053
MARKSDPEEKIINAAMKLAAAQGWRDLTLADIAKAAKLKLSEMPAHFPSRTAILAAYGRRIDARVLDEASAEDMDSESARDRLFDVLMMRFDAMAPEKKALKRIAEDMKREPLSSAVLARPMLQSMSWMLEAAGIDSSGFAGALRARGLALIWASAFNTWLEDDDDQSKTMAVLDRRLADATMLIERVSRFMPKRREAGEAA